MEAMTGLVIVAHGLTHVPVGLASDIALCGDVGDRETRDLAIDCPVCVASLKRRTVDTTH